MQHEQDQSSERGSEKLLARMPYASTSVLLPDGTTVVMNVDLQEDGGVYVGHSYIARDNQVEPGETCFKCGNEELGCMKCPKGQSPHGDCVKKTITCEPTKAIPVWRPSGGFFSLG